MTDVANKPAPAKPARRPGKWAWFWLAPLIAIAGIALAVCLWPQPVQPDLQDAFTWLTPAETAKVFGPPGSLTRLKFRFLMWSPRIWNWYVGSKTQIQITISWLEVPSDSDPARGGIVAPDGRCFTNSDGMRSWIVPTQQWPQAQRDFQSWRKSTMSMTTTEGMDASLFSGALGAPSASTSISPRLKRGGFDLLLNATYSSPPNANATNSPQPAQSITNLAVLCRAIIPNGGALVVDGGKYPHAPGNENYWLIISPVAVDSKGKPKKI